jgi:predicted ATP-grasp superfamily ATP-dependent carboligase
MGLLEQAMKILIFEYCSAVGSQQIDGRGRLSALGWAMLQACVEDCVAAGHEVHTLVSSQFAMRCPVGSEVTTSEGADLMRSLERALTPIDAALIIAPETGGTLSAITALVEQSGKLLLGSSSRATDMAADKLLLPQTLASVGCKVPATRPWPCASSDNEGKEKWVLKPRRGAGCEGIVLTTCLRTTPAFTDEYVLQPWVKGTDASVSLIVGARQALVLSVNYQKLNFVSHLHYEGGAIPLEHPMCSEAIACARKAVDAIPGLRGFVGIDMVLAQDEVYVIEVNPRITFAYCGLRQIVSANLMEIIFAAASGRDIPRELPLTGSVEFDRFGEVYKHAHP